MRFKHCILNDTANFLYCCMKFSIPLFQFILLLSVLASSACKGGLPKEEIRRYEVQASRVTIIRDNWGVPHVYGKTDADAVFGVMYAQCEDNFARVEANYIMMLGRTAEVNENNSIYDDLRMQLLYDTTAAIKDYNNSPTWLKQLCNSFAAGINYYLYKNPNVKPALITRFQPWYPLLFTDGGITHSRTGGISEKEIESLYGSHIETTSKVETNNHLRNNVNFEGSNAFAIAPSRSAGNAAMLYINPHTPFYYRTELHMVSEEGLNAYGAVTWGQFFVFQGFNDHCGWAHTASEADAVDVYEEKITGDENSLVYDYDGKRLPLEIRKIQLRTKAIGADSKNVVITYRTQHGPVMGIRNGKWLSVKETNRSLNGLVQSWQRTKAKNMVEFKAALSLRGNNANNTMYADDSGNIAYWHGNFIPTRNASYDWSQPVDGSTSATDWKGTHSIDEIIHFENPAIGWLQNCNSSPYTAAGNSAGIAKVYPAYMAPEQENFRSLHLMNLLSNNNKFTLEQVTATGYSRYLSAFDSMLPPLISAYINLPNSNPLKQFLAEPIKILAGWDKNSSSESVPTTIATEWAYRLIYTQPPPQGAAENQVKMLSLYAQQSSPTVLLKLLRDALLVLQNQHGRWQVPWGELNRYQRASDHLEESFDDNGKSIPVPLASSLFGSLPSYEVNRIDTKRRYGTSGNSFIAAVEFGKRVRAKSLITGGQSFDPSSKHFNDQAIMFAEGKFKDVLFYKEDIQKNKERVYHPGQ